MPRALSAAAVDERIAHLVAVVDRLAEVAGMLATIPRAPAQLQQADRLLKLRDVCDLVGVSDSAIYEWMAERGFPRPRKLSPGLSGSTRWHQSEVLAWIDAQPRAAQEGRS